MFRIHSARRCQTLAGLSLLMTGTTVAAHAGPVSGAIYDTDYLKAQPGGFAGIQYPRYTDQNGADVSQMVYPDNGANVATSYGQFAFVVDTTTGATAPAQATTDLQNNVLPGRYTYSFPYLPPGRHDLVFIEAYRNEVYKPSTKRVSVTVPASNAAATADINLARQWRLNGTITNAPLINTYTPITGISADYLTKDVGWVAVATNNGNSGFVGIYAADIYQTLNGGATWTKLAHIPAPVVNNFGAADVGSMTPPQFGLHFTDAQHGVLMAQTNWNFFFWGNGLLVLNTSDGGKTWTPNLSNPDLGINSAQVAADTLFVNGYYSTYTNEVAWDPANRANGVMYGPSGDDTGRLFTRVTTDGGQTWTPGKSLVNAPDVGASAEGNQRFFVYNGNNFSFHTDYGNGLSLFDGAPAWQPLQDTLGNAIGPTSNAFIAGRAWGQSALAQMNGPGGQHLYRTDNGGQSWRQNFFYNGQDGYGGSLIHSYSYLASNIGLMPDNTAWLSGPSQTDTIGRSLDGVSSRTFMGALGLLPNFSDTPGGNNDASLDIHTGRRVLLMDPAHYGNTLITFAVLNFAFDEESPAGLARISPLVQYTGYHYNAAPGMYVNLVNTGGDWAKNVTITGITATNGAQLALPALPWNVGAIPPASTTGQTFQFADPGEMYFTFQTLPSAGTRFSVTLTGTYNNGQTFRATVYINV